MANLIAFLVGVGGCAIDTALYVSDGVWYNLAAAIICGACALWSIVMELQ